MFRPKKMRKVRLIVLKSKAEALIQDLHEAGLVDIRKADYEGLEEGRPLPSFDQISSEILRMRSAIAVMEQEAGIPKNEPAMIPGHVALAKAKVTDVPERLLELNAQLGALKERLKTLDAQGAVVEKLSRFKNVDFSGLSSRTIACKAGEISESRIPRLSESLERMGNRSTLVSEAGSPLVLVLFERAEQQKVESVLSDCGFNEIQVPAGMTTPADTIHKINTERETAKIGITSCRDRISGIAASEMDRIRSIFHALEIESERAEIASRFPSSRFLHVIEGWVLDEEKPKLDAIAGKYGATLTLEDVQFGHDEMPPTVLDNPKAASPMEFITKSYSLPNYYELDPTMAYMVALPIIYGMIVGDVLYGLLSMVLAYLLMKKFEKSYIMYNVSKIWLVSGIPTVVFGLFYDEWAGLSHFKLAQLITAWTGVQLLSAPLYIGFQRMESVLALIGLSILVGMIHLALGFVFGAINEWEHNKMHSLAKIAWIGVELGLLLALLPFLPSMLPQLGHFDPNLTIAGIVLLVVSVAIIAAVEGIIGIIEVPGLVGNILSYSRIAAIGVVGVVIAELLNQFIVPTPDKGLIMALVLAPIFIVFHILNCFIAMFESIVQGGRLNIVEFRSKFMHGGGDVFIPFALYSKKL